MAINAISTPSTGGETLLFNPNLENGNYEGQQVLHQSMNELVQLVKRTVFYSSPYQSQYLIGTMLLGSVAGLLCFKNSCSAHKETRGDDVSRVLEEDMDCTERCR